MKNNTILLMIVLIAVCWFGIFRFSGMAVVYLEEPHIYAGRTIILERVYSSSVIISVDGEKDIFTIGDPKAINGIEISVSKIIYFPEKADRSAELHLSSSTVCSDGKCELGEDSNNCCIDCGCEADYSCESNQCEYNPADQCQTDSDCDDLNMSTKDYCYGEPKTCKYQTIQCHTAIACDDNNPCTEDSCSFNECINKQIEDCKLTVILKQTQKEGFLTRFLRKLFNIFN